MSYAKHLGFIKHFGTEKSHFDVYRGEIYHFGIDQKILKGLQSTLR